MTDEYDTHRQSDEHDPFPTSARATLTTRIAAPIAATILAKLAPKPNDDIMQDVAAQAITLAHTLLQQARLKYPHTPNQ